MWCIEVLVTFILRHYAHVFSYLQGCLSIRKSSSFITCSIIFETYLLFSRCFSAEASYDVVTCVSTFGGDNSVDNVMGLVGLITGIVVLSKLELLFSFEYMQLNDITVSLSIPIYMCCLHCCSSVPSVTLGRLIQYASYTPLHLFLNDVYLSDFCFLFTLWLVNIHNLFL